MTAFEKLATALNPTDRHAADELFIEIKYKCPDEFYPCAATLCKAGRDDESFLNCVKCWLQEVSD